MSTAGKVLVVLVMLTAIACLLLAGGVAQLNYNANQKLQQLADEVEKTRAAIEAAKLEIMSTRDQTTETQENLDREIATLDSHVADLERSRSQISDTLSRLQYDSNTVKGTIDAAKESLEVRNREFDDETKAMASLRRDVQTLRDSNAQLMARLDSLRKQFKDTHNKNLGMIGKPQQPR